MTFQIAHIDHPQHWNIEESQDRRDDICSTIELYPSSFNGLREDVQGEMSMISF